jgi:hypothetical protein
MIILVFYIFDHHTLSAALECSGTPSSYFPVSNPHANGDQVIVPIPKDLFQNFFKEKISIFVNLFFEKHLVEVFQLFHVEINDIQLVHI